MAERDFLDKMIAKRTARNAEFPQIFDAVLDGSGRSETQPSASEGFATSKDGSRLPWAPPSNASTDHRGATPDL